MSHRLLEFFYVADLDYSWLAKFLSLLFLPLAHEDLAILLGGYLVVNQVMPVGLVVVTIYLGMVVSDLALYGDRRRRAARALAGRLAVNGCVKISATRCNAICSGLRRWAGLFPAWCLW